MSDTQPELDIPLLVAGQAPDEASRLLADLQRLVMKHPVASQALFAALVAQGRRWAGTPEGTALAERLRTSHSLARASRVFEAATLWMLDGQPPDRLPETYVDALLDVSQRPDMEEQLQALFGTPP